jgi:hypothetical protein
MNTYSLEGFLFVQRDELYQYVCVVAKWLYVVLQMLLLLFLGVWAPID